MTGRVVQPATQVHSIYSGIKGVDIGNTNLVISLVRMTRFVFHSVSVGVGGVD